MGNELKNSSGIELSFDYLSCSFPVECLEQFYKIIKDRPLLLEYGFRGYKNSGLLFGQGRVAWTEGRKEAHVDMKGQSLKYYTEGDVEKTIELLKWIYSVGGKLSRIDIAFDEKVGIAPIDQVIQDVRNDNFVSRAKSIRVNESLEKAEGEIKDKGKSVYIGSKTSEVNLRIYDKAKEQNLEGQHWTRFEMMLRNEASNSAAMSLINAYSESKETFVKTALGLMRGYCDFRDKESDKNVSRRVMLGWWSRFVDTAEKIKLIRQKIVRNISKVVEWIERQVAPNLAVLKEFYGIGFPNLIQYLTFSGKERWRSVHENLLADNIRLCRINV